VLKAFDVPGASVAIVKDGRVALAKGYGVRELRTDAYITFALNPDGTIEQAKMAPTSPTVDFSYDFQDLLLKRKKTP